MSYEELIETVSLIVENPKIFKKGLKLTYELDPVFHNRLNEKFYELSNPYGNDLKENDEFEVVLGGLMIKFLKNKV